MPSKMISSLVEPEYYAYFSPHLQHSLSFTLIAFLLRQCNCLMAEVFMQKVQFPENKIMCVYVCT